MLLTFEVYKKDNRCRDGYKRVEKFDTEKFETLDEAKTYSAKTYSSEKFSVKIFVTMVERTNIRSGVPFMERYDTPTYCSPAFEAYWNM